MGIFPSNTKWRSASSSFSLLGPSCVCSSCWSLKIMKQGVDRTWVGQGGSRPVCEPGASKLFTCTARYVNQATVRSLTQVGIRVSIFGHLQAYANSHAVTKPQCL